MVLPREWDLLTAASRWVVMYGSVATLGAKWRVCVVQRRLRRAQTEATCERVRATMSARRSSWLERMSRVYVAEPVD